MKNALSFQERYKKLIILKFFNMNRNIQKFTKAFDACKTNLTNQEWLSHVTILINIHEALRLKNQ